MKKLLLPLLLVAITSVSMAQEDPGPETKNIAFKFAPAALRVGKISIGSEYNFGHRNSVTLYAGIPYNKTSEISYQGVKSNITSRAFSAMAGYRHYLSKKNMKGFYLEPYAKYVKHEANGVINTSLSSKQVALDTHSYYEGIGAGAQIGLQLIISRSITLDLFLIGPEVNKVTFNSLSRDVDNNNAWTLADGKEVENDIREILNNVPVIGNKVNVQVDTDRKFVTTDFAGVAPGFRIGGSVGVRF